MNFEILTEFPLQVEIEAYKIQDIYDKNFTRLAQPRQTTKMNIGYFSVTNKSASVRIPL